MERLEILCGDALERLKALADCGVQCCVTSPPYWGLRDYGTAKWEGGDSDCDHVEKFCRNDGDRNGEDGFAGSQNRNGHADMGKKQFSQVCGKCGAKRIDAQLGLEKTPEEYVAKMVEVFREVRRVLRNDGTLWLNLGDSFYNYRPGAGQALIKQTIARNGQDLPKECSRRGNRQEGLKEKDLVGIPWMVAFALRADGWYLRSDIIWAKPNPMPESVTDRCTKAHEYIFLLTKQARYFYDAEAIKEPLLRPDEGERTTPAVFGGRFKHVEAQKQSRLYSGNEYLGTENGTRNKRSVWTVTTQPYPEAHFATFPPDLIKPCILAGSKSNDTILDPFAGSGTTGQVALELGRKAILIELNPKYIALIEERCNITPGLCL